MLLSSKEIVKVIISTDNIGSNIPRHERVKVKVRGKNDVFVKLFLVKFFFCLLHINQSNKKMTFV